MISMRYLSRTDALAAGAGDWDLAVADVRDAIGLYRSGQASMVAESVMPMGADPREKAYGLPASLGGRFDAAGLKWTVHRADPVGDLPSITSTTFINRLSDGRPLGVVESGLLTTIRTAAVSALAIECLLPQPPRRATLLGAGRQAESHLAMLMARFPTLEVIHLWNRTAARLDALVQALPDEMSSGDRRPGLVRHQTLDAAIDETDVILCCTSAPAPILLPSAVRADRLIIQAGFHEASFDTIAACDIVTADLWGDFAEKSAKSLFQMYRAGRFRPEQVAADLAALVVDGWRPPACSSLYFSSFGLNLFDIALARRVLQQAERNNIGTVLPLL